MTRRLCSPRLSIVLALIVAALALAQSSARGVVSAKDKMAVLDLEAVGTGKVEASAMTERLREALLDSGKVALMDRSQMNTLLDEQAFQQATCTGADCTAKAGKLLGVEKILSGKVVKLTDTGWQVSAQIVQVETAQTLKAQSIQFTGDLMALIDQGIPDLASRLDQARNPAPAGAEGQGPNAPSGEKKELVAVMDLEAVGSSRTEAVAISERLREMILNSGRVTLVDRAKISAVLDERALQQASCVSQKCTVDVGKVLGVRRMVTGKVMRLSESGWQLSGLLLDVETAETLRAGSVLYSGNVMSLLDKPVRELSARVLGPIVVALPAKSAPALPASPPVASSIVRADAEPVSADIQKSFAYLTARRNKVFGPGETVRLAVFPFSQQGNMLGSDDNIAPDVVRPMRIGLRRVAKTVVEHSWYPYLGPSLRNDGSIPKGARGTFSSAPDKEFVQKKGRALGVDGVLMVHLYLPAVGGGASSYVVAWLEDVQTGRITEVQRPLITGGKWRMWDMVAEAVEDAVQRFRDGF